MTDAMDHNDDHALAAEYALGLLDASEVSEFETRMATDPGLRDEVARWTEHFATLTDTLGEVEPPRGLYSTIEAQLFPQERRSLWARLGVVQAFVGAAAAALVLFAWLEYGPGGPGDDPVISERPLLVAELGAEGGSLTVIAALAGGSEELELTRTGPNAPNGHSYELWLIVGENAPVSLGVLPSEQRGSIAILEAHRAQLPGATLAVSVEPEGGSPTGAPTGDVVAVGAVNEV